MKENTSYSKITFKYYPFKIIINLQFSKSNLIFKSPHKNFYLPYKIKFCSQKFKFVSYKECEKKKKNLKGHYKFVLDSYLSRNN